MSLFFSQATSVTRPSSFSYVKSPVSLLKKPGLKLSGAAFALALLFSCSAMADKSSQNNMDSKPKLIKVDKLQAGKKAILNNAVIDINTATASQLSTLVNIGLIKAQEIVAYRKAHGNFASIDQLAKVKGIGTNTIEQNRKRIHVAIKASIKK
ncbi:MAG: competence protein ComEA [Bermanella sp.]|jgi:competence protein ComEA